MSRDDVFVGETVRLVQIDRPKNVMCEENFEKYFFGKCAKRKVSFADIAIMCRQSERTSEFYCVLNTRPYLTREIRIETFEISLR